MGSHIVGKSVKLVLDEVGVGRVGLIALEDIVLLLSHCCTMVVLYGLVLFVILCSVSALGTSFAPESPRPSYFVGVNGSDSGPGSQTHPFATVERGLKALEEACGKGCDKGASLKLLPGTYRPPMSATETWMSLKNVSGGEDAQIEIAGMEGARIVGSWPISMEKVPKSDPVWPWLLGEAQEKVVYANLTAQGFPLSEAGTDPSTGESMPSIGISTLQGKALDVAVWPDADDEEGGCVGGTEEPFLCSGWARISPTQKWSWDGFEVSEQCPLVSKENRWGYWKSQPGNGTLRADGFFAYDWAFGRQHVKSVSVKNRTITFQQPWYADGFWGGSRYRLTGAPEAISRPGEYFIDTQRGMLYAWVEDGSMELEGWRAGEMLHISNSHHIQISNLTFFGSRGTQVVLENVTDVDVVEIELGNTGAAAVHAHFPANERVSMRNLTVRYIDVFALWLEGGDRTSLRRADHLIEGCVVEHFGRRELVFTPGISVSGVGIDVRECTIRDGPSTALHWNGNFIRLHNNHISDAVKETLDMGACTTGGYAWTQTGNTISNNLFTRIGPTAITGNIASDPLRVGIYIDRGHFGGLIEGNVFVLTLPPIPQNISTSRFPKYRAIYEHGTRNATIQYNLVFDANFTENNPIGLLGDGVMDKNGTAIYEDLEAFQWRHPPYATSFPALAVLDDFVRSPLNTSCANTVSCGPAPWNNSIVLNIAVNTSTFMQPMPAAANFPISRFNITKNLINKDPKFVSKDPRISLDFRLQPNSPALIQGFPQLPSHFGAYESDGGGRK